MKILFKGFTPPFFFNICGWLARRTIQVRPTSLVQLTKNFYEISCFWVFHLNIFRIFLGSFLSREKKGTPGHTTRISWRSLWFIMMNLILHMIHKIRLLKDLAQQFLPLNLQAIKGFALLFLLTSCFLHNNEESSSFSLEKLLCCPKSGRLDSLRSPVRLFSRLKKCSRAFLLYF